MVEDTTGGNTVDSPTTDGTDQDQSLTDQIQDAASDDSTDQSGQDTSADSQAADTSEGVDGDPSESDLPDKDTLPFDQHPKWQSARAAEKKVQEILDTHGYDTMDDLGSAIKAGNDLVELIGDYDAKKLVDEYKEFQNVKKFWADQDAAKREADEEPEGTIDRLKREKQELLDGIQQDKDDKVATKEGQRVLEEFDAAIRATASASPDASDTEKAMLTEFLGVDNEIAAVDPTDKAAVKRALSASTQRFNKYMSDVKQQVIDDYVKGKSEITPVSASDTSADTPSVTTESKPLPPDTTMDQANAAAKDELTEIFLKMASA